jgi:hypothetical protein
MLSKMARPPIDLQAELIKCRLVDLKDIARELHLRISGSKTELITRISNFRKEQKGILAIQRTVRGWFVRSWLKLKGPHTKKPCVNDTDFYTMDPLEEIPFVDYIEYTDPVGVNYGFHMRSLYYLLSKMKKFDNPYTREDMKPTFGDTFIHMMRLTNIIFPQNNIISKDDNMETCIVSITQIDLVQRRINELFIQIDALGHYSNITWFTNLSNTEINVFIVRLYHIWTKIPRDVREQICPNTNPFTIAETVNLRDQSIDENRKVAITIGELMICSNQNEEYRNLAAMYFLTALTLVSRTARVQMPWLYENYFVLINGN